jgi:hypothetical protein
METNEYLARIKIEFEIPITHIIAENEEQAELQALSYVRSKMKCLPGHWPVFHSSCKCVEVQKVKSRKRNRLG